MEIRERVQIDIFFFKYTASECPGGEQCIFTSRTRRQSDFDNGCRLKTISIKKLFNGTGQIKDRL